MFSTNADSKPAKIKRMMAMKCDRCPPHRKENHERTPRRSWKLRTRRPRQHK